MSCPVNEVYTPVDRPKGFVSRVIHRFLKYRLSCRIKRMIFLSSLLGFTKCKDLPSIDTIIKINEVLGLAHDVEAIKLPIFIRTWLWNHEFDEEITVSNRRILLSQFYDIQLSRNEFERLADYIISKAPDWLIYAGKDTICNDLESLHLCTQS